MILWVELRSGYSPKPVCHQSACGHARLGSPFIHQTLKVSDATSSLVDRLDPPTET